MDNAQAPQYDTIYQAYGRDLYKRGYDDPIQDQIGQMSADGGADNSTMVNIPADLLGSGQGTGQTSQATNAFVSGKEAWGDQTAGFFIGIDVDGIAKWNFGNSTNFIRWDGSTLTIVGGLSVSKLDIPDTTTANSFHVDTAGNAWWGANVATGYPGANAYILNNGAAVFKNVAIGGVTTQYVITNSGIFSYGDGSDGDVTISAGTTLTRDMYYRNLTVNNAAILNLGQWRIFCSISLTLSGNGVISSNGTNATSGGGTGNGSNTLATRGIGAAGLAAGYFLATTAGSDGDGGGVATFNPGNVTNSIGTTGIQGGGGGAGSGGGGSSIGPGTYTGSNVKLIANWHLATMLDINSSGATVKFQGSSGASGGGRGGPQTLQLGAGGGGGGAGSTAGILAIYAKIITIGSGSSITANGGAGAAGGNGFNGGTASGGGGGGGGGGSGGAIVLVYNTLTNGGSITASGGTGGAAGNPGNIHGSVGNAGPSGAGGVIYQFQLSL